MINHHNKQQTGGTLLGIIVGLIVGLGIAVVVAVTISKTSLPLSNKSGKQEKLTEPTAGQVTDPNKPLYGNKAPAKEAAREFAAEPTEPTEDKPVVPEEEKKSDVRLSIKINEKPPVPEKAIVPEKIPAPQNTRERNADARGESKEANKPPVVKSDNLDEKWIYYLQASAFREQTDAENTKAKLALLGFETSITHRPSENGPLYRVRVGPFSQLDVMNRVRGKLSDSGVDVAVVRASK